MKEIYKMDRERELGLIFDRYGVAAISLGVNAQLLNPKSEQPSFI